MDEQIRKLLASTQSQPMLALAVSEDIEPIQADENGTKFGFQCQQYVWQFNPLSDAKREDAADTILEACDSVYHEMNTRLLADQRIKFKMDMELHPVYKLASDNLGNLIDAMILQEGCYSKLSTMMPMGKVHNDDELREAIDNVPMLSIILYVHVDTNDRDRLTLGYGLVLQWVTPTGSGEMVVRKHVHLTDAEYCLF